MPLTCEQLLRLHAPAWETATVHPFLTQCAAGTIQTQQFNTWLVQDYLFVLEFTRMAARLLAAAPVEHYDVLLSGLGALKEELLWFRDKAQERGLQLDTKPKATCAEYAAYMGSLADSPYAVQATAFWAIELAYNQGWQKPGVMAQSYQEFAQRWGNPGFTDYVMLIQQQADQALSAVAETVHQQAEAAFLKIARLERDFWQMAFDAD